MTHALSYTLARRVGRETKTTTHASRRAARIYAYCVHGVPLGAWWVGNRMTDEVTHEAAAYRITDPSGVYRAR